MANMAYDLLQLLKTRRFLYIGSRFGSIDHNGASKVSKFSGKKNRPIISFYAFMHTANGLELMGSFRHAALLFVHSLLNSIIGKVSWQGWYFLLNNDLPFSYFATTFAILCKSAFIRTSAVIG